MRISDWSSDVCSSDLISTQHFSTPLALAWLVSHLAAIGDDDIVLEPSAGVGMLATWADRAKAVCINEIDPVRAGLLRHLFPGISVTRSAERRVGKECVSTCRSRWSPSH